MTAAPASHLLAPEFLRKLERLSLVAKRSFRGQLKGEKRSPRRGSSVEFADYRDYTPGDDLRRVDWNTYARLERLFLKLFMEEEDLHVYLLVDSSRSMGFGEPSKLAYACRVAAALGYVGLTGEDRVGAALFAERPRAYFRPARGRGQVMPLFRFLEGAQPEGETVFGASLREIALRTRRPGIAVVISDGFGSDLEEGLKALLYRKFQVTLLHVLAPEEIDPPLVGDLKLIDAETGETREITVSVGLLRDYRRAVENFCARAQGFCHRYGADYLRAATETPFEDLILTALRRSGLVK
jgi:uncharacterized protein (DUF58 family)